MSLGFIKIELTDYNVVSDSFGFMIYEFLFIIIFYFILFIIIIIYEFMGYD